MTIEKKCQKQQPQTNAAVERQEQTYSRTHAEQAAPPEQEPVEQPVTTPVGRPLQGAKAIADYCNISHMTLMKWIYTEEFPATQIGGIWQSDTRLIDRWRIGRIETDTRARATRDEDSRKQARW